MHMNEPSHKPSDERELLIAINVDGAIQFTSGWYDINDRDYYTHDGELIEMSYMIAWCEKPSVEFSALQ